MSEFPPIATRLAAQEAIRNQQHNLEDEIRRLMESAQSLPEGKIHSKLIDEISALDSITDVIPQALESIA